MKNKNRALWNLIEDPAISDKTIMLSGPRQVGKTTTAQAWLAKGGFDNLYYNWDSEKIRREYRKNANFFESDARSAGDNAKVVFDEIHKMPEWKNLLKGYIDTMRFRFFVTGSARLELFQRSGDSMLGRYHLLHLWPLIPGEVEDFHITPNLCPEDGTDNFSANTVSNDAIKSMLEYSGFPEPFLKQNKRSLNLWHREYRQRIIREDLKDLTRINDISKVEHLMELLPVKVGSPLSLNSLKEDLYCSHDSVRAMVGALNKLYIIMLVRPYSKNIKYALSKEPKIYFIDWSCLESDGNRFENFIAVQLKSYCDYITDGGWHKLDLFYVRDKQKHEVDFLIVKDGKPAIMIEAKKSQEELDKNLAYFSTMLGDILAVQVVQKPGIFIKHRPKIWSVSANRFFNLLWLLKQRL